MAHSEHNKQRKSGGFFLIIFGAILFMLVPWQLSDSPELGFAAIVFGFIIGGIGFYIQFVKGRRSK
jgi:vacuolar-type H+-ATPase subunit I/STV1